MVRNPAQKQPLFVSTLAVTAAASAIFASAGLLAAPSDTKKPVVTSAATTALKAARPLTEDEKIVHVLNRLGYGPRPGDVESVKALGLDRYIDRQLNPEKLDDPAVDKKLATFTELTMSGDQLTSQYHDLMQSSRQAQAMRKRLKKQNAGTDPAPTEAEASADPATIADPAKKQKRAVAMDPASRREATQARQQIAQAVLPVVRAHEEFMAAKALRAVESERQLQEVLVDFWGNHFNIDIRKPSCGILKILDDREAIRPHVFGKFRELLGASAHSPAMLVYLDNFQSMSETAQPDPVRRRRANRGKRALLLQGQAPAVPPKAPKKRPTGLNENYAREIMELHTLGVDGGYTQQDVHEVARCFTGWSVSSAGGRRPGAGKYAEAGAYRFYPALHDSGEKTVLGHMIPAGGGEQDGEKVLDILATHPATMRHVAEQLCQRLVADEPPGSLLDKCVAAWKRTDGDLREIVRTIVKSPEFYSPSANRSKIKSPFEYAVSSVRALGGTYETAVAVEDRPLPRQAAALIKPPKGGGFLDIGTTSLIGQVGTMGQPLFQYQAPTGYPEDSRKWVSSGALISRLNFALALTGGKLADIKVRNAGTASTDPNRLIDGTAQQILHVAISPATRATLKKQVLASDDPAARTQAVTVSRVAALLLGSPEFQRH
jgi:uncharacterized protein (DUF1800 family)